MTALDLSALPIGTRLVTGDGRKARLVADDAAGGNGRRFLVLVRQEDGHDEPVIYRADGTEHPGTDPIVAVAPKTIKVRTVVAGWERNRPSANVFIEGDRDFASPATSLYPTAAAILMDRTDEVAL